jgi:transposase
LFAKALMIEKPWYIDRIDFDQEKSKLDLWIDFARGSLFAFDDAGLGIRGQYKAYNTMENEWRHLNFFQFECHLHARFPRLDLGDGRYRQATAPWEGLANGFTLLFEAFMFELVRFMPVHQVAKLFGLTDQKLWTLVKRYTELARDNADYSAVKTIGMDETAASRGHDYVTLFVDLDQRRTLYVTGGKDSDTLAAFCTDLQAHRCNLNQIEKITCDKSPTFIKGVEESLPQAAIIFDRFHVTKVINEAFDIIRKKETKNQPLLKGSQYLFLTNRENLHEKKVEKFEEIRLSGLNQKTMKALHIREYYQQIYLAKSPRMFERLLKKWYYWATHCRLEQMIKSARTIKKHWQGVLSWANQQISNGLLEGFSSLFQATKAKARGYVRFESIRTII